MFFSRGPNKIKNPYTVSDFYDFYLKEIGDNKLYEIDYKEYSNIISDFYKSIMDFILKKNGVFKMPYKLGDVRVVKRKLNLDHLRLTGIDWKTTVETGKHVYHLNEHTSGYKYNFQWNKKNMNLKNLYFYRLVMTRQNKRLLAKLIKSGDYDYFENK